MSPSLVTLWRHNFARALGSWYGNSWESSTNVLGNIHLRHNVTQATCVLTDQVIADMCPPSAVGGLPVARGVWGVVWGQGQSPLYARQLGRETRLQGTRPQSQLDLDLNLHQLAF